MNKSEEILKELEGKIFSSVEFVSTYYQLRFDGPQLNVINYPKIVIDGSITINYDAKEFCYYLLKCLGSIVEEVKFENETYLAIRFNNSIIFNVSMKPDNYQTGSVEALLLWDNNGKLIGVW